MNNNPYEAPNSPPYVTRENDRTRNAGMPYVNPNDQPLMVPKRFGFGYSFNWNNRRVVYLFMGLLAVIVVVILIAVLLPVLLVSLHH